MHYDRNMHQGCAEAPEKVKLHAEHAQEFEPNFLSAWILLAGVYLNRVGYRMRREDVHALAPGALYHALDIDPDNPEVIPTPAELARGDHLDREALLSKGDYDAAIFNYEESLEIAGNGFLSDGVRATLAGIGFLYSDKAKAIETCRLRALVLLDGKNYRRRFLFHNVLFAHVAASF